MVKSAWTRLALSLTLLVAIPAATAAQDETPSLEGTEWHLTAYADDAMASVPFFVEATLLLDSGTASGSTGCTDFSTGYTVAGDGLELEADLRTTREACPGDWWSNVESGYLAALPQVAAWVIEEGRLRLTAADGRLLLELEQPVMELTASDLADIAGQLIDQQAQIAAQQAHIDRLTERIDNVRIGTLRDRITTLENALATLQQRVRSLGSGGSPPGGGTRFTAAESVLRSAVPARLRATCAPLRSRLPSGTVAAVTCDAARDAVAEAAYYLMEYADAVATLRSVAGAKGAPNRRPHCGQRSSWWDNGAPVGAEACWVEQGTANFRLVAQAASCRQLDAGATHLTEPVIYLALEGRDARMAPLRSAGLAYTDADIYLFASGIARSIPHGDQPLTPACRRLRSGG